MDIWQKMYEKAQALYQPQEVSDFVYARHVVAAVEAEDGQIFTGFCMEGTCGVFHLCAERAALFNMYQESGQTKVKRIIAFRDQPPHGGPSGMPCGACREFLMELHPKLQNPHILSVRVYFFLELISENSKFTLKFKMKVLYYSVKIERRFHYGVTCIF